MKFTIQLTKPEESNSPPMSPSLKRILSSRVVYAVSLPPPRRKNGIWKVHTWVLLSIVVTAFILLWLSFAPTDKLRERLFRSNGPLPSASIISPYKNPPESEPEKPPSRDNLYGVVFDAGSTGTRVHVFELTRKDPTGSYTLADELFEQVTPGLSAYADSPDKAASSLDPLLTAAEKRLPRGLCTNTSVVLRATAGLRLLPLSKADAILNAVRQRLANSCLLKTANAVSILDGHQEGLYLWISLNFMTNRLPSPIDKGSETALHRTVGTLDLGGGSTQITFAPLSVDALLRAPPGFATAVDSGEVVLKKDDLKPGKHIYSQSYLGLGLMSARFSVFHTLSKRLPPRFVVDQEFRSPCFPPDSVVDWSHAGREWKIRHIPWNESASALLESELKEATKSLQMATTPSSVLVSCYAFARSVLRDPADGNPASAVYPPHAFVVHRPEGIADREFYAFSYIFDLALHVGLIQDYSGSQVTIADFRDAANRICSKPDPKHPFDCMDLCFITALLHDAYGFPWDKKITLQKKINTFEISWGLGAMFAELSARNHS